MRAPLIHDRGNATIQPGGDLMISVEVVEVRVDANRLQTGMYVCRLDRDWIGTPFEMQGFLIRTAEDAELMAKYCQHVFIDDVRSIYAGRRSRPNYQHLQRQVRPEAMAKLDRLGFRHMRGPDRPALVAVDYPDAIELAKELPRAQAAWKNAKALLTRVIARAKAGKPVSEEEIELVAEPVVESVVRSPDAALWLAAIRRFEPYPTSHPLNCCALVLVFARFLSFPPEILLSMAKGAILMDIGMWRLNQNYYIKADSLEDAAKAEIHEHVLRGLEYLRQSEFVDLDAILMILHHHERFDGNGYPRAVRGIKVSLMGQMLGIADTFDALCSKRSYHAEETLNTAQKIVYKGRDEIWPAEVVESFFQSMGVYPTGSMVQLSNGQIAAVSGQMPSSRLYPRLILLTNPQGVPLTEFEEIESSKLIQGALPVKIVSTVARGATHLRLDKVEPKVRSR